MLRVICCFPSFRNDWKLIELCRSSCWTVASVRRTADRTVSFSTRHPLGLRADKLFFPRGKEDCALNTAAVGNMLALLSILVRLLPVSCSCRVDFSMQNYCGSGLRLEQVLLSGEKGYKPYKARRGAPVKEEAKGWSLDDRMNKTFSQAITQLRHRPTLFIE